MLTICRSSKGGSGTSTITAGLAALTAHRNVGHRRQSAPLVVDLAGDLPAIFGVAYPSSGLAEWLNRMVDHEFSELLIDCGQSVRLMSSGSVPLPEAASPQWDRLAAVISEEITNGHQVFVDCGTRRIPEALVQRLTPKSGRILLVLRPCYLALRRAMADDIDADGIILVTGGGRVLTCKDVEAVLGLSVVAEVPLDPDIARRVDSGLFHSQLPKALVANLSPLTATPTTSPLAR